MKDSQSDYSEHPHRLTIETDGGGNFDSEYPNEYDAVFIKEDIIESMEGDNKYVMIADYGDTTVMKNCENGKESVLKIRKV